MPRGGKRRAPLLAGSLLALLRAEPSQSFGTARLGKVGKRLSHPLDDIAAGHTYFLTVSGSSFLPVGPT